jgi:Carboxypeptidase regulatory-like domain
VSVLGRTSSTGADGTFSIANVPTVQGNLIVSASFTPPGGPALTGTSAPTPPVRGGTTNVGDIVLIPALFEPDLGTLVLRQDDGSVTRALPFSFSYYGNTYNQVFVSNNGNLSFNVANGDFTETVSEFLSSPPRISAFWDDLIPDSTFGDTASGLYVNDQLPGRIVVTWLRELEFSQVPGPNTIQVILFSDGRIQYGYQGIASLDAIVGLSPGGLTVGNPLVRVVDFSNTPFLSTAAGEAIYEQFEVPAPRGSTDPLGSGQNFGRNNPFDLDGGFIVFTPNPGGGYDLRTILPQDSSNHGTVTGTVLGDNGQAVAHAEVEILSSRAPRFRALVNTDAQGRYSCANVPCGGKIIVRATKRGNTVGHGVGEMLYGGQSVRIDVHTMPPGPAKN